MKKWLPFIITFVFAAGGAAAVYFLKGSEIERLTDAAKPSAIGRASGDPPLTGRKAAKSGAKPEEAKLNASLRPTRNGIRSLFERAGRIMDMDKDELEKLLTELEKSGGIRSPISGVSLLAAYARMAELDPAGAMDRAMKAKGELRDMAMFATMNEWLSRDRKSALAWFAQSKDEDAKKKYLTVATISMAGADPELLTDLGNAISDPESRKKAMLDAFGALAFTDPDAALKKLDEIEDPEERAAAEEKVFQGFLYKQPEKALDYAISKPPGDKARDNARNALVQWGEQDAGAALKWLGTQSKEMQKELFDSGDKGPGWGFGKATPEEITATAAKLSDQSQKDKLHAAYANAQAHSDPKAGLNQLSSIRDPELQMATARSIGGAAAMSGNAAAMNTWLETAVPNDTRDTAVAAFAAGMATKDPAEAAVWAGKITNGVIRNETINALKNPPVPAAVEATPYRPGRRPR